ncbi:hypothetical protein [Nocardioides abyssi]|uniref:Uncharacterized protein n=1 Tax=Nocardioides abyssi TaxID=3058370 RepID=A0ABT8ER89_9ACTN|nr:hypothetical protein [Nocardioides abyssi]MDN4160672.1 hypothetical protein [Nocardioides abyssi]
MSAENLGQLVVVLVAFGAATALPAWTRAGERVFVPAAAGLLVLAGLLAAVPTSVVVDGRPLTAVLVVLGGVLAVAGGGPVTARVFALVDREDTGSSLDRAGRVLRGGAWIGALERAAIYATLVTSWPEGLAVVLALKGLGRYPELRAEGEGTAERFIIGTFTSVLWAAACAAVVVLVR